VEVDAVTTMGFAAFGHTFRVETPVPALDAYLDHLFGDLQPVAEPEHLYRIETMADGRWVTRIDGATVEEPGDAARAVALLLWRVNRGAIEDTRDRVLLHAGGVVIDGAGVMLAGDMEVGKTTLVTGLLRSGADYLSDEAIGLTLEDDLLHGYAKALSLDPGSWPMFPEFEPDVPADVRPLLPHQWQVRAADLHGVETVRTAVPALVVLPRYREGSALEVRRLPASEALLRLSGCVFPTPLPRRRILERLARLLGIAPCYELQHGDLTDSVTAVRDLVRRRSDGPLEPPSRAELDDQATPTPTAPPTHVVDDHRRPAPRPGVAVLTVADEWVLHVADTDELLRLDRLGASLWPQLDGQRSVRELIDELADGFGGDRSRITAGVSAFLADLDAHDLIVDGSSGSKPATGLRADGEQ
jgi:hypothetical protein